MKIIYKAFIGFIIIVLSVMILMTVFNRDIRENEAEKALQKAVDTSLSQLVLDGEYSTNDNESLISNFSEILIKNLSLSGTKEQSFTKDNGKKVEVTKKESDPNFRLQIAGNVDADKGIIAVVVKERFTHPNGQIGNITVKKVALLDQEKEKELYTVTYKSKDNRVVKKYTCEENEKVPVPGISAKWKVEKGTQNTIVIKNGKPDGIVTKNIIFIAE